MTQEVELGLFIAVAFAVCVALIGWGRKLGKGRWAFLLLPGCSLAAAVVWMPPDAEKKLLLEDVPKIGREQFTGSSACRSCHAGHYESWHDTYHRTMTQLASEESVVAPFDGRTLEWPGIQCKVSRQGRWFVAEMADPDWESSQFPEGIPRYQDSGAPRLQLPIVMTTGSHHLQAYWVPSTHGNKLRLFPWVYHIDSGRWMPNGDSFINPPDANRYSQIWNNNCILCHSVAGDVGYDPGNWQSSVAELGISCEACHGPGEAHVKKHRNPLTRYLARMSEEADETIVNPARLSNEKSSEVCGQCHTAFSGETSTPKNVYRAGADYHSIFTLADPQKDESFWKDGTMRIGGREFSGMIQSQCYLKGELSCISCHSMHASDPDKQMQPGMLNNDACTQCHAQYAANVEQHTHHAAGSEGSLCYNCHMPYSSYALFNAVRSHRIDSPTVKSSIEAGRPNACNQCHVDQTLAWTDEHLQKWYGHSATELTDEHKQISATALWLLKGDAIQRVLAAWTMGWKPATMASGMHWQPALLQRLLDDPYTMARYNAWNSLKKLGIELEGYDFLADPKLRNGPIELPNSQAGQGGADTEGASRVQSQAEIANPKLADGLKPLYDGGHLSREAVERLLRQRDNRPITLTE